MLQVTHPLRPLLEVKTTGPSPLLLTVYEEGDGRRPAENAVIEPPLEGEKARCAKTVFSIFIVSACPSRFSRAITGRRDNAVKWTLRQLGLRAERQGAGAARLRQS